MKHLKAFHLGILQSYLQALNFKLCKKNLQEINTLAYYENPKTKSARSFITLASGSEFSSSELIFKLRYDYFCCFTVRLRKSFIFTFKRTF